LGPGAHCGEYRIEAKLGRGGFGTVYTARHRVLGRPAAIKVLHQELLRSADAVERFADEARIVNRIRHPSIVDVYEFGQLPDGRPYLVMEPLSGQDLATRLDAGPVPPDAALAILGELASALAAGHATGVVHRDVKPENVFLLAGEGHRVKLLDFGIAKATGPADADQARTRTGVMIGSPRYAAPEQAGGKPVTPASDVYSLGVLAFRLFCGRVPFEGQTVVDTLALHLHAEPPDPRTLCPSIPQDLRTLILAMLDKSAQRRPTLPRVRRSLREVAGKLRLAGPQPLGPRPRARWRGIVAAAGAMACIGLVGWWQLRARKSGPPPTTPRTIAAAKTAATAATPPPMALEPVALPLPEAALAVPRSETRVAAPALPARPTRSHLRHGAHKAAPVAATRPTAPPTTGPAQQAPTPPPPAKSAPAAKQRPDPDSPFEANP
jgi:serine/threonine-protein kinase